MRIIPDDVKDSIVTIGEGYDIYSVGNSVYFKADTIEITDDEWDKIFLGYRPWSEPIIIAAVLEKDEKLSQKLWNSAAPSRYIHKLIELRGKMK